jgi:hypothetical protein
MRSPSLNSLADMVISKVQSGLKSVSNHGLSKFQIKDEIILTRNRLMVDAVTKGLIDIAQLRQDVIIEKFTQNKESKISNKKAISSDIPEVFMIPNFESIEYVGSTDGYESFKLVTGKSNQFINHDRFTKNAPTAWVRVKEVVIYNDNPRRLLLRYVLNNPMDIAEYDKSFNDDSPFPLCSAFADMIVGNIVNDYMRQYRMANPQANNQIEINQSPEQ